MCGPGTPRWLGLASVVWLAAVLPGPARSQTSFPAPSNLPSGLAYDGRVLLVADRGIYEVDPRTGAVRDEIRVLDLAGEVLYPSSVAFDAASNTVFVCDESRLLELDRDTWDPEAEISIPFRCGGLAWDGAGLVVTDTDSRAALRMSRSGQVEDELSTDFRVGALSWDASTGRFFATGTFDEDVHVLLPSLDGVQQFPGPQAQVRAGPGIAVWGSRLVISYGIEPDLGEPGVIVVLEGSCGDGRVTPREECDDGNRRGGDCCSAACRQARIQVVEEIEWPEVVVVSGDGSALGGAVRTAEGIAAFSWRPETGVTYLITEPLAGLVVDLSEDGRVRAVTMAPDGLHTVMALWDEWGVEVIGALPGATSARAEGISGDGEVVVGNSYFASMPTRAGRWTAEEGLAPLPVLGSDQEPSSTVGVSADGTVVAGQWGRMPFRWSEADGVEWLDPVGSARGISADGSTILLFDGETGKPALWRGDEVLRLPPPPGPDRGDILATDLSGDGTRVISERWIWIDAAPPVPVSACDEPGFGWKISRAQSISDDGNVIAGLAYSEEERRLAPFVLALPEPSAARLGAVVLVLLVALRRRGGHRSPAPPGRANPNGSANFRRPWPSSSAG